jgi:hypothetical protein
MIFYVYENWTAEHKAVIHIGSCGYCKEGRGCHRNPLGDRNGQWHGPFTTLDEAQKAAEATGRKVRYDHCVKTNKAY